QAFDEALLAAITVVVTAMVAWRVWRPWIVTSLAALIVVRQTMEIGSVLAAAIDLRLFVPAATVLGALTVGSCAAWGMRWVSKRLSPREAVAATRAFAVIFFAQSVIYAFHEFAEAGVLPASDVLHAATE